MFTLISWYLNLGLVLGRLKELLECPDIIKVFHDCRNDAGVLHVQHGIMVQNIFDTQVMNDYSINKYYEGNINKTRMRETQNIRYFDFRLRTQFWSYKIMENLFIR